MSSEETENTNSKSIVVIRKGKKYKKRKPSPTQYQLAVKSLKTRLANHIWHIKRIEKDLVKLNTLHQRGTVLKVHARGKRPKNI